MFLRIHLAIVVCFALTACVTTGGSPGAASNIAPGERPEITTDEAGLWMASEDVERQLVSSGRVITDPALNAYVKRIICRLSPEYCEDIRFYIVRTPHFNASMHPNGFMQVWTGLMLRAQNEAQLAYVLGHELGHYLRRHGVQQWRTVRGTASAMTFFRVAAAAAGAGYVGDIGYLVAMGALFSYSREFEREADDVGFDMMVSAGYHPGEAARIWQLLLAEKEASDEPDQFIFFATHPSTEERIGTLETRANAIPAALSGTDTGTETHRAAIQSYLSGWLRDDLRNRRFAPSEVMLNRMIAAQSDVPEFHFYLGELYRLRGDDGDNERAVSSYLTALKLADPPSEVHRSLGLAHWRNGRYAEARTAFENYLRAAPQADDKAMIESYLDQL